MSAFPSTVDEEVRDRRHTRVNALASTVGERAAALRFRLERVDRDHCDAFTTAETPGIEPDVPVEIKSVRVEHHDGTGRIGVHPRTHDQLVDAGGIYAVVLYGEVSVGGVDRIVVLAVQFVEAAEVGRYLPPAATGYQKVRWDLLLDGVDVDRARWSA